MKRKPLQIELRWRIVRDGVKVKARTRHGYWFRKKQFYFTSSVGQIFNLGAGRAFVPLGPECYDRLTVTAFVSQGASPGEQATAEVIFGGPAREWR